MADTRTADADTGTEQAGETGETLEGRQRATGPGAISHAWGSLRDRFDEGPARYALVAAIVVAGLWVLFGPFGDVSAGTTLAIGLQTGAVYSLIGLGVALVYKATRVLNFAQGELGGIPVFVAYAIMIGFDWSDQGPAPDKNKLWWATIIAIAVGAALAVAINVFVVQRLADASPVISLVATIGVTLLFTALEVVVFEAKVRPFPRYVDGKAFSIGNTNVSKNAVIIVVVLIVAAALLAAFFRSRAGVALLATAQEPFAAELQGVSVRMMSVVAWALAGVLAAVGALLGAGVFEQVRPGLITTTFLIPALVGIVLGGLTSMVGAVLGGLILGVVTVYANIFNSVHDLGIPGAPQVAQLGILLLVLLFRPRGLFGKEA